MNTMLSHPNPRAFEGVAIDKAYAAKLRKAVSLSFRLISGHTEMVVYTSNRENREPYYFPCATRIWGGKYYSDSGVKPLPQDQLKGWISGNITHGAGSTDDVLATIAAFLKAGDRVQAQWAEGNNNGYVSGSRYTATHRSEQALNYTHLYHDTLHIVVMRPAPTTIRELEFKYFTFFVGSTICADNPENPNNSARLCRRVS